MYVDIYLKIKVILLKLCLLHSSSGFDDTNELKIYKITHRILKYIKKATEMYFYMVNIHHISFAAMIHISFGYMQALYKGGFVCSVCVCDQCECLCLSLI